MVFSTRWVVVLDKGLLIHINWTFFFLIIVV